MGQELADLGEGLECVAKGINVEKAHTLRQRENRFQHGDWTYFKSGYVLNSRIARRGLDYFEHANVAAHFICRAVPMFLAFSDPATERTPSVAVE